VPNCDRTAVDDEGEVLDMIVQHRRDTAAALKLLKRLMWSQKMTPKEVVTDGLKSYLSALTAIYNTFNTERHLISRKTLRTFRADAHAAWAAATAFH
jgi:putative transposase